MNKKVWLYVIHILLIFTAWLLLFIVTAVNVLSAIVGLFLVEHIGNNSPRSVYLVALVTTGVPLIVYLKLSDRIWRFKKDGRGERHEQEGHEETD